MVEMIEDLYEAVHDSYMNGTIPRLEVEDREAADRQIARLESNLAVKNIEVTETVLESRPALKVSATVVESDFQLYIVWPIDRVTNSPA